ncbi:MAG: PRC-barrel domain containing protein, partial [Allopontixanthobacter sediminis]
RRDASGVVTGLLVEIEDSDPDRYVQVPLSGLSAKEGTLGDIDVQTSMTSQELAALPEAPMSNP